jgi:adenosylcobinamide-GDP ribazoletransferase
MRDHAIGAFGVTALLLVLLFEASALAAQSTAWTAFAAAGACARWSALPLAAFLPYARAQGQGATLVEHASAVGAALGLAAACAVSLAARGSSGLAAVGAAAAAALVLGVFFRHWLGGVTGDALGATTELAQAAALAALLVAP